MASSKTAYAVSRGMRARLNGTPHWLLRLPALAWLSAWASKASRKPSLVPVLPTLPVTATTRASLRVRAAAARLLSASMASSTTSSGPAPAAPAQSLGYEIVAVEVGAPERDEQLI